MTEKKSYIKERDVVSAIMRTGNTEEVIRWYDKNASLFDEQFDSCGFTYHLTTTKTVCDFVPDKSAVILDIGAGSGVIGKLLHESGYSTIDAIDASKGMLKIAEQKNIYRSLVCAKIGTEHIQELNGGMYDALVSAALFAPGAVYYESIPVLMSHLRSGGYMIFTIADRCIDVCPRLSRDKFMKMTTEWEHENICQFLIEKRTYHINKERSSVIVLQRL